MASDGDGVVVGVGEGDGVTDGVAVGIGLGVGVANFSHLKLADNIGTSSLNTRTRESSVRLSLTVIDVFAEPPLSGSICPILSSPMRTSSTSPSFSLTFVTSTSSLRWLALYRAFPLGVSPSSAHPVRSAENIPLSQTSLSRKASLEFPRFGIGTTIHIRITTIIKSPKPPIFFVFIVKFLIQMGHTGQWPSTDMLHLDAAVLPKNSFQNATLNWPIHQYVACCSEICEKSSEIKW